jgi:putative transposase
MTMTGDPQAGHPLGADDAVPVTAWDAVNSMIEAGLLDQVMSQVDAGELALTGDGGFLPEMIKAVLERGLAAEQTAHLGYERGDPAARGTPNSRNGTTPKTVATEVGDVALDVPRDRGGTFEPRLVPKGSRRNGLDEMVISLYAGGMTVRDIAHHLQRTIGTELSHDTISKITDGVVCWRSEGLPEFPRSPARWRRSTRSSSWTPW